MTPAQARDLADQLLAAIPVTEYADRIRVLTDLYEIDRSRELHPPCRVHTDYAAANLRRTAARYGVTP